MSEISKYARGYPNSDLKEKTISDVNFNRERQSALHLAVRNTIPTVSRHSIIDILLKHWHLIQK